MIFFSIRRALVIGASALALTACSNTPESKLDLETQTAVERIVEAVKTAKSTEGLGHPALWTLADDDTTVYLFGTVHLLPPDLKWKTDALQAAFNASDTLYLEIDQSSEGADEAIQTLVLEHGMFPEGTTLSSTLTEDDLAAVATAAEKVGIPLSALDPAKPWFAGLQLGLVQIVKSGYNPNAGVEQILSTEARAQGKAFGNFESALDQVKILSGASIEDQIQGLVFTAKTVEMGKGMLDTMVDEWVDGDVAGLSAMMGEPSMFGSQEAYNDLIVTRNRNWIPQIEAILDEPGVKFVAVGAGHLAGPDSVIKMLRDKGHKIEAAQ